MAEDQTVIPITFANEWSWLHDVADQLEELDIRDIKDVLHNLANLLNDREVPTIEH
tara:strand:- start:2972 stop:3139 length:168 start_codon:yes stop_codon:yes gene_type:complete